MRRAILLVSLIGAGLANDSAAQKVFPYETHEETLENGLKVILVPMESGGVVAHWTVVRTGARDEYEEGHTGFAHFFEHMMFRGTEKYPPEEYNRITTEMGASGNAFTSDDLTAYHSAIAAEDLELLLDLESDRFKNLKYSQEGFKTEAGAVYGEYRKNRMSPMFTIYERLHKEAFTEHTYGHTAMGYEEDIKEMPNMFEYSQSFFSRYYRPDNVTLVIVGDIEPAATFDLVKQYYGDWESGYVKPKVPVEPVQTEERRFEVEYPGRSLPILWVAYKATEFDPTNRDYAATRLLLDLAFGETSPLYKKLVLDEQAVQFIQGDADANRDPGLFSIYSMVKDPDKVDYVLGEIDDTLSYFRDTLPDAQQLADVKSGLRYGFLMNLDTPGKVASSLADYISLTGGIEAIDQLYTTYEAITPEDIQSAARKYFVNDRRTVGVLKGQE